MAHGTSASFKQPARGYRGFLVDLDGTLLRGEEVVGGAASFLAEFGDRTVIVSNNSTDTPMSLSTRMARLGLRTASERIVLAGTLTIDLLSRQFPGARVMLLGSGTLAEYAKTRGLRLVQFAPDVVVIGRDASFDYRRLQQAAYAIRDGAQFYACNPDLSHPGEGGQAVPETGALVAAVAAVAGRPPDIVVGKPNPALFEAGLAVLGIDAAEALVIGDNPATDGAGASRLGIAFRPVDAQFGLGISGVSA